MTREEAMEIIKRNCTSGSDLRKACEFFIPGLAESEDENLKNKSGYYKAGKFWKASTLWNAVKSKSPQRVSNRYILQECTWNISSLQRFADEVKNVQEVDLNYPIILDMNGNILDGAHRVVKAYLEGKDIDIVYLGDDEWPEPDYDEEKAVKESEDEMIRRELLEYAKGEVRSYDNMVSGDYDSRDKEDKMMHKWWKKIVVYLEKQKALSELGKYIASERTKPGFMFSGNDSVSWEELPLQVRKHDYPYYFIGDLDCYPFVVEDKKPVECSKNNKDKPILTILVDALKGNAQLEWELKSAGVDVKKLVAYIEEQTEELSTRLNGLMQEYVKSGKDEEDQEHRLKCYQLFWDALGDSEFFEQKEQKPDDVKREWWNKGYLEGRKNAHIPARELGLPSSWDFQKEQKPLEQKYEGEKLHNIVIAELGKYNGDNFFKAPWATDSTGLQYPLYFANLGAKWQKDQKSTEKLSKEDYVKKFKTLCDAYEIKLPNREYDIYHLCDDLSKLSIDFGEQNHAEWSEEDNVSILIAIDWLKFYRDRFAIYKETKDEINTCIKCLNSLRSCPKSSNYWKPSEEQMRAILNAINYTPLGGETGGYLKSLYNDLKKL